MNNVIKNKVLNGKLAYHSILQIIVLLVLLGSCKGSLDYNENAKLEYKLIDELTLEVPDTINYNFEFWLISQIDSNIYLEGLVDRKIEIFDLIKNQYVKRINLNFDGPNGVGRISQFYLHNFDSIFVFSKSDYVIYLIDSTSKVVNKYYVNNALQGIDQALSIECFRNYGDRIVYNSNQNTLLLRTYPPYDLVKDVRMYESPFKILYDIKQDTVISFFGIYPSEFRDINYYYSNDYQVSYCNDCPKNIFSFRRSHDLYEIDLGTNEIVNRFKAKSNFLESSFELIPRESTFESMSSHFSSAPSYDNIFYDNNKELYYRLVSHNLDGENKKSSSIIVLDKKLNVVGEILLPSGKYFIKSARVMPKGILIYKYNSIENVLSYDLITPKL